MGFCCWRCEARLAIEASPIPAAILLVVLRIKRCLADAPWRFMALVACALLNPPKRALPTAPKALKAPKVLKGTAVAIGFACDIAAQAQMQGGG